MSKGALLPGNEFSQTELEKEGVQAEDGPGFANTRREGAGGRDPLGAQGRAVKLVSYSAAPNQGLPRHVHCVTGSAGRWPCLHLHVLLYPEWPWFP